MSNAHRTPNEKIESYLRNKMSEDEKVAFQFELLQNERLRADLEAFRTMQKGTQAATIKQQNATPSWRKYITGLVILFSTTLITMLYFYPSSEQKTTDLQSFPVSKSAIPTLVKDTLTTEKVPTKADAPLMESSSPKKIIIPPATPPTPPLKKTPPSQPIAANFHPNPVLENLIGSQVRGNDLTFALTLPTSLNHTQNLPLHITLITEEEPNDYLFRWLLFSNQAADYQNFQPLKEVPLDFAKADENYVFEQALSLDLPAGLYYYLIEDVDSGDIFNVGKVEVK